MTRPRSEILAELLACREEDEATAMEWWTMATADEILLVWAKVQEDYDDPVMECVSRFAQLGMIHLAVLELQRGPSTPPL